MVDQQIVHEEIVSGFEYADGYEEEKSVYSILATYVNDAEKTGTYVKGYIDGEETYHTFLNEYNALCKTKFIIRTSWRKLASTLPRKSRYGKEERIYWEYNSGNLIVPFSGVPFVVRSCLTKHCQYGSHYYKTTAERVAKQFTDHQNDPSVPLPMEKKRRNKPSKKRDCPAIMHVREVVMFPDFSMDVDRMYSVKCHPRQEKSRQLYLLKDALAKHKTEGTPLKCIQRFYINLPLPEVHIGHPEPCGGIAPTIHQAVTDKIDSLVYSGVYDARHVRVIVHDFVRQVLLKQNTSEVFPYHIVIYPSETVIADYIYMTSITAKPSVIIEGDEDRKHTVKAELEGSINELMDLFQSCHSAQRLSEAKDGVKKIIDTVKSQMPVDSSPRRKRRKTSNKCTLPDLDESTSLDSEKSAESLTRIVIVEGENSNEQLDHEHSENVLSINGVNSFFDKSLSDDSLFNFHPVNTTIYIPISANADSLPMFSMSGQSTYNAL